MQARYVLLSIFDIYQILLPHYVYRNTFDSIDWFIDLFIHQKKALDSLFICCRTTEPIIANWKFRASRHSGDQLHFECYIDAGYINKDDESYMFLDKPKKETLDASLEVSI